MTATQPLQTVTFGPHRAVGMRYTGKCENQEIKTLWEQFIPRMCGELAPLMRGGCVGVCRCVPGKTDGTFDYIAAMLADPTAPVPEGLIAVDIPQCDYAVFTVPEIDQCPAVWQAAASAVAESDWISYCSGPDACDCATHPSFEYYPPEYRGCSPFSLYIPVKRKTV